MSNTRTAATATDEAYATHVQLCVRLRCIPLQRRVFADLRRNLTDHTITVRTESASPECEFLSVNLQTGNTTPA